MLPWRMLVVEDDPTISKQIRQRAESGKLLPAVGNIACDRETDFASAVPRFESTRYDFVVLDVRGPDGKADEQAGVETFSLIKERAFVPVIFYTAVPESVRALETAFVRVVEKTQGLAQLTTEMERIYRTGLPELRRHLEEEQRTYLWDFVTEQWAAPTFSESGGDFVYLLARRLARILARDSVRRFLSPRGMEDTQLTGDASVHPVEMYIMPPVGDRYLAGDLVEGAIGGSDGHWVVLTPSCDFEHGKAANVLLARCDLLTDQDECKAFCNVCSKGTTPSINVKKALLALMSDKRSKSQPERFKFLPGVFEIPDLVVDFQRLVQVPEADFLKLKRLASLDAPFAEALVSRFSRYYGRLGTPDLNTDSIMARLTETHVPRSDG